jgi:hypothetical protein
VKRKGGDRARIAGFWRAVEIFSPQQIPAPDSRGRVVDFGPRELMPWEAGSRRYREAPEGKKWRHQVFGGVYGLSRVRDVLTGLYPDETEGEPAPTSGQSALFACVVDESGTLVEASAVLSSCAWAVGRAVKHPGKLPLDGFEADVMRYGESLGELVGAPAGAGVRLLASSMRGALPDALAQGAKAAVTSALVGAPGPVAAMAATFAADVTERVTAPVLGDGTQPETGEQGDGGYNGTDGQGPAEPTRLDLNPLRGTDLQRFTAELAGRLGVQNDLEPRAVRVRSYLVSLKAEAADEDEQSFLNSFFGDDLQRVADALGRDDAGEALTSYLTSGERVSLGERVDLRSEPGVVWRGCTPDRIPSGRWVADLTRPLALSQQFAVNEVMRRLAGTTGLFAVNGPPGTGKTTLLRDLVAAIVVARAEQLATLPTTAAAFESFRYTWETETREHRIAPVTAKLTGLEIVVASTNNGAVANVTTEIPGPAGIGTQWADAAREVDYFASTARLVHGAGAWGMIAAQLGNRKLRDKFAELFWWGNSDPGKRLSGPRLAGAMVDALTRPRAASADWKTARAAFRKALKNVQSLAAERRAVASAIERISVLEGEIARQRAAIAAVDGELLARRRRKLVAEAAERNAVASHRNAAEALSRHQGARPGLIVSLSTGFQAGRDWHATQLRLQAALDQAAGDVSAAQRRAAAAGAAVAAAEADRGKAANRCGSLTAELARQEERVALAVEDWGDHVPAGPEFSAASQEASRDAGLEERRERTSPWADDAFAAARTELFLAALALHKAFIMAESVTIKNNLRALVDVLKGKGRPDNSATLALWQTFFLVVPVVSTTFASLPSMFAGLGRESLGWLFIDEAGQVAPQHAVGGIWRAKRVVVVGDPLQLEPVVTLPWGGQRALLAAHELDSEWAPTRTSVQRLADRQTPHGTYLPDAEDGDSVAGGDGTDGVWVGSPLRVHRRCDHPMLDISNEIAYGGLMVDGVPADREPFPGGNYWYNVQSAVAEGNWIEAEGDRLGWLLAQLRERGVTAEQIRVISPFRKVAEQAAGIHQKVFTEVSKDNRDRWVGTVHTMQGKEADVVILILGGNPDRPRARTFATSKPNLLNVAVTRARRRLYVIGNHATWGSAPYFRVLARHTEIWPPPAKRP